ncbi:hypothetical protein J2T09_002667 [Neorhizobium huautlense]|uniref:Uncharacterized protein n=1 Tax=Neorhizobium huautlense TaxID=67774 RepID=A0ABT9PTX0_9HYPH|nr:hypothetical protein [Neorhizobium huautlense]MDP9837907.1 hypothetical protein [Neorhizobium huautlense]
MRTHTQKMRAQGLAMFSNNLSSTVLSSDDLEEIDRFHTAWCEENGVDKTDAEALDVASSLIDWYASDEKYRSRAKLDHAPALPESERIKSLLMQIT